MGRIRFGAAVAKNLAARRFRSVGRRHYRWTSGANFESGPLESAGRARFSRCTYKDWDGAEMTGDVEVHLRAGDWEAHGHARDPAYGRVGLHVVLFPASDGRRTLNGCGRDIPVLALLPLLRHDLEEYAANDAVARLAGRRSEEIIEQLGQLTPVALDGDVDEPSGCKVAPEGSLRPIAGAAPRLRGGLSPYGVGDSGLPIQPGTHVALGCEFSLKQWTADGLSVDSLLAEDTGAWSCRACGPPIIRKFALGSIYVWCASSARLAGDSGWILSGDTEDISGTESLLGATRV